MKKLAFALLTIAACGDNVTVTRDAPMPDAATTPRAVAVSGNFMAGQPGVMSSLDLISMTVAERVAPTGAIGNDPVLRKIDGELFVVNRTDNNVTVLDAATFAVKEQLATGAGSNPQDVAAAGTKLYVPSFGSAGVVVLTRGTTTATTIDLSALDPDMKPNCISAYLVGTDVYIACEILNDTTFVPRGPGKIVVIDSASDTIRTMFDLSQLNPFGVFEALPEDLGGGLVIPSYTFDDLTKGCVERITTGATPSSMGCLATNMELGGLVNHIEFQRLGSTPIVWMTVSWFEPEPIGNLQGLDLETGDLWPEPLTPTTQLLVDMTTCPDGKIVVADATMDKHGLRVYDGGLEVTTAPLAIGLKPASSHGLVCY